MVIKKDGSRQPFDRQKLIIGIMKSCEKRPITTEQIEHLIDNIEHTAKNALKREISTAEIGEQVLKQLQKIDEVAYVRFASVYRAFSDINSFISEISALTTGDEGREDSTGSC
jgi:transcriptional repressor NrdR